MRGSGTCARSGWAVAGALSTLILAVAAAAQAPTAPTTDQRIDELSQEVADLKALVHQLQDQLAKVTGTVSSPTAAAPQVPAAPAASAASAGAAPAAAASAAPSPAAGSAVSDALQGVTVNALLDGYYAYNFNAPVGRINSLRAYDVSSNSFSLNQADLILERAADPTLGRRFGMRLDLQFGQATSTLQGNPANELRPDVYRNVFQAYGTYVAPVMSGLTVDFGKWASSLGIEGNYTKDQLNYSRSFWFDYLPFYHMGLRSKLAVNDQFAFNVWITNGTNQTEAFNNYKDQLIGVVVTPTPAFSWTFNVYQGQEHPNVIYIQNPTPAQSTLPNQQGTYILPVTNPPDGRLRILDTYVSWQLTRDLILAAEADFVEDRLYSYDSWEHVYGGALYGGYQLSPQFAVAARAEYLADIGGLYSGATQYLKEGTLTLDYRPADGFLMRGEYRRDQSNHTYFLGPLLGDLKTAQPTLSLGLVWWFGGKQNIW